MSDVRYLTIPPPARVAGLPGVVAGAAELPFAEFVAVLVLPRLPRNAPEHFVVIRALTAALCEARAGDVVELFEAHRQVLQAAMPELSGALLLRCLDFYEAVATAATTRPSVVEAQDRT